MSGLMINKQGTEEQITFGKKYIQLILDVLKQFPSMENKTEEIKKEIQKHTSKNMEVNVFSWGDINILFEENQYPIIAVAIRTDKNNTKNVEQAFIELDYEYVTDDYMPYDTISHIHYLDIKSTI